MNEWETLEINKKIVKALVFLGVVGVVVWYGMKSPLSNRVPSTIENATDVSSVFKPKNFSFEYKFQNETFITEVKEISKESAFKVASKKCFQHFTGGKYPGEEKGLEIIDSCANPKKGL